jgi:hypothetical protein
MGRPTTTGLDVPERIAQVTYLATACERAGDKLPNDLDRPDPIQRNYHIDKPDTRTSNGIHTCNQPFFDTFTLRFTLA